MRQYGKRNRFIPEVQEIMINGFENGLAKYRVCTLAGISHTTFEKWERYAADGKKMYVDFINKCEKAKEKFILDNLKNIKDASDGNLSITETKETIDRSGNTTQKVITTKTIPKDWRSSAWLLGKIAPEDFGENKTTENNNLNNLVQSLKDIIN